MQAGRRIFIGIILSGAVHKYYDYPQLQNFFTYLRTASDSAFYERLVWIGLENGTFEKGKMTGLFFMTCVEVIQKKSLIGWIQHQHIIW